MPTMLDFSITQVYRLISNDLLMMWDAWVLYKKYKKTGRSLKEYSEVLANLMDVESENFEEIKLRTKLNVVDNANLSVIIWDFLHEIIIKHFIDDLSQYPFWMAKVSITTGPQVFGMSAVQNCLDFLRNTFRTKGALGLYEGVVPYLWASVILNYKYIVAKTNEFVVAVLAKIPHSPSLEMKNSSAALSSSGGSDAISSSSSSSRESVSASAPPIFQDQKILRQSNASGKPKRSRSKPVTKESMTLTAVSNVVASFFSHPFLVVSLTMIKNPGSNWIATYVSILANKGIAGLYRGVRTRALLSLVPFSPIFMLGITDTIMYRRMLGQGSNTDGGGLVSVLRQIVSREGGGIPSLMNYGLLTLVQLVPGFVSFLTFRTLTWIVFGRSLQRMNQMSRRKEIVESHMNTLTKKHINSEHKSSANNLNNSANSPPPSLAPAPAAAPQGDVKPPTITRTAHFNL